MVERASQAAQQFWDGDWNTVGPYLVTDVAKRMAAIPGEVLILQPEAFAPFSYMFKDQEGLFKPHLEREMAMTDNATRERDQYAIGAGCADVLAWLMGRKLEKWEFDFSNTYVLHAFDNEVSRIWGWDHSVDVKYVLARQ